MAFVGKGERRGYCAVKPSTNRDLPRFHSCMRTGRRRVEVMEKSAIEYRSVSLPRSRDTPTTVAVVTRQTKKIICLEWRNRRSRILTAVTRYPYHCRGRRHSADKEISRIFYAVNYYRSFVCCFFRMFLLVSDDLDRTRFKTHGLFTGISI